MFYVMLLYLSESEDLFASCIFRADDIASDFHLQGISCQCIHGDR